MPRTLAAAALAALTACAATTETPPPASPAPGLILSPAGRPIRAALLPTLRRLMEEEGITGLSIAVASADDVLWAEGFGYADRASGRPATPQTVYQAGSLAKPLTAIGVMLLAKRGRVELDGPVSRYLPAFSIRSRTPRAAGDITLRDLLSHHSGLPTDRMKGMWTDRSFTEVVDDLRDEYLAYPPRLVFSYSNLGYSLLGQVIQAVTDQPFAAYMDEALIRPLALEQTGFQLNPALARHVATGYRGPAGSAPPPMRDTPALGLYTSVLDLTRLARALMGAPSRSEPHGVDLTLARRLFEPQNRDIALDLEVRTGLGWFIEEDTVPGAGRVVRHGGTTLRFAGELILLPEHRLAAAVLANSAGTSAAVGYLAQRALSAALSPGNTTATSLIPSYSGRSRSPEPGLAWVSGRYATSLGLLSIDTAQRLLCACIIGRPLPLEAFPDGWFRIDGSSAATLPHELARLQTLQFAVRPISGRDVVVAREGEREFVLGERMGLNSVPDSWARLAGQYEVVNPDPGFPFEDISLRHEHGFLCLSYSVPALTDRPVRLPLQPVSDEEATVGGLGRGRGETVHSISLDGQPALRFSGYLLRRIR